MAFTLVPGHRTWSMRRDDEGHREYEIEHMVKGLTTDGPFRALNTPGLPLPGATWSFDSDFDPWAWCRPTATVTPVLQNEPNRHFLVKQTFSTKPNKRCGDNPIEDPLLEPVKVSGSFVKEKEEATHNRFGFPINNSAHEQVRGPKVEFDHNRPNIKIEFNKPLLNLALLCQLLDGVNDSPLWGLAPRCIKLSGVSWERKYQGFCSPYYTITLEFEINFNTFDRQILDEGTKVLRGQWDRATGAWRLIGNANGVAPDPTNPQDFVKSFDKSGALCKIVLNGYGLPAEVPILIPGSSTERGDYYVSVADSNLGNSTWDNTFWRIINGSLTPSAWLSNRRYKEGNLVTSGGSTYVAASDNLAKDPFTFSAQGDCWILLPFGLITTPGGSPTYDPTFTYSVGEYVQDISIVSVGTGTGATTGIGTIQVEKYPSVNLLVLGIPLTF